MRKLSSPGIRLRRPKTKDPKPSKKGQAAALDLAVFISICILALSYLFIQSIQTSASAEFIQENENVNEVAIRALSELADSSGGDLEIKTVQPIALKNVSSCLSNDIQRIMGYIDSAIDEFSKAEKQIKGNQSFLDPASNPFVLYVKARISDVRSYLSESKALVTGAISDWLDSAISGSAEVCDIINFLASFLPGYNDMDTSCLGVDDDIISDLMGNITFAEDFVSDFEDEFDRQLESLSSVAKEKLLEIITQIRCALINASDAANSFLTYLETGLDTGVSIMELRPVEVKVRGLTLEKMLSDSITAGNSFAYADDVRSIAGISGLILLRGENISNSFLNISLVGGGSSEVTGVKNQSEDVIMLPIVPLDSLTNKSAVAPYNEMEFGAETYLTGSGNLAIRLRFIGDEIGGVKQKTEYFEGMDYILNSSSYGGSTHRRTYNGSSVKGIVEEATIDKTIRTWNVTRDLTDEISSTSTITEYRLLRPMAASVHLTYDNRTWANESYSFDIEHVRVCEESDYGMNTSKDCNSSEEDALKSVILGTIFSGRGSLKPKLEDAIHARLDELLEGYAYKFEVRDCCSTILSINNKAEPIGRSGTAKRYFTGAGSRAEMRLIVWRD